MKNEHIKETMDKGMGWLELRKVKGEKVRE